MVRVPGEKEQRSKRKQPTTETGDIIIYNDQAQEEKPIKEVTKNSGMCISKNINIQIIKRSATYQYNGQNLIEKK